MINIFGLIIFIAGFVVPFLSGGRIPYDFFFWFGFLLLMMRSTITGFLNVLLYVCLGAIIGRLKGKRSGKPEKTKAGE